MPTSFALIATLRGYADVYPSWEFIQARPNYKNNFIKAARPAGAVRVVSGGRHRIFNGIDVQTWQHERASFRQCITTPLE
jgi:hypothetical protein